MTAQPTRDQLRALAGKATPGPWEADHAEEDNSSVKERGREWWDGLAFAGRPGDAEFIAAARSAVPALLDHIDQLEAQVQRVRDVLDHPSVGSWTPVHDLDKAIRRALDDDDD